MIAMEMGETRMNYGIGEWYIYTMDHLGCLEI